MVRSNGRAALGAVLVAGGADQVRMPREPDEKPPPARASACDTTSAVGIASASATAATLNSAVNRLENLIVSTLSIPDGISSRIWASQPRIGRAFRHRSCDGRSRWPDLEGQRSGRANN